MARKNRPETLRRSLAAYAAAWLAAGAIVAVLLVAVLRSSEEAQELPPVESTELSAAVRAGRCEMLPANGRRPGNPPADGPFAVEPAEPDIYTEPQPDDRLVAAVRRGTVVVHYRRPVDEERLRQLELLHEALPLSTVVTPNGTDMPFVVAVVSWQRVLGCRAFSDATLDALRLFAARNVGRGPDSPE